MGEAVLGRTRSSGLTLAWVPDQLGAPVHPLLS